MLTPPEGITTMSVDSSGNFICNGSAGRALPVWTDNPQALCQASQQAVQQPANAPNGQPQQNQQEGGSVPDWIKQMFGQ